MKLFTLVVGLLLTQLSIQSVQAIELPGMIVRDIRQRVPSLVVSPPSDSSTQPSTGPPSTILAPVDSPKPIPTQPSMSSTFPSTAAPQRAKVTVNTPPEAVLRTNGTVSPESIVANVATFPAQKLGANVYTPPTSPRFKSLIPPLLYIAGSLLLLSIGLLSYSRIKTFKTGHRPQVIHA